MDSVLKEVVGRNALKQQGDAIARSVLGYWLGEFSPLELIRSLDDLFRIQSEVVTREEKEWASVESSRRQFEANPFMKEVSDANG